VANPNSRLF